MSTDKGAAKSAAALPLRATRRQSLKDISSPVRPAGGPRHASNVAASTSGAGQQAKSSRAGRPANIGPMPPMPAAATAAVHARQSLSSYYDQQHPERAYLAATLRRQDERAMKLFQSLRQVEQRLAAQQSGEEEPGGCSSSNSNEERGANRRKLRKEAALLRRKLAEAEQQERLILLRLGDIYVELQRQERRAQAEHQHQHQQRQRRQTTQAHRQPVAAPPALPIVYSQPFWAAGGADCTAKADVALWRGDDDDGNADMQAVLEQQQQQQQTQAPSILAATAPSPERSLLSPLSPVFEPRVKFSDAFSWSYGGGAGDEKSRGEEGDQAAQDIDPLSPADGARKGGDRETSPGYICSDAMTADDESGSDGQGEIDGCRNDGDGLPGSDMKRPSSPFLRVWSGRKCGGRSISINTFSLYYSPKPWDKRMSLPCLRWF